MRWRKAARSGSATMRSTTSAPSASWRVHPVRASAWKLHSSTVPPSSIWMKASSAVLMTACVICAASLRARSSSADCAAPCLSSDLSIARVQSRTSRMALAVLATRAAIWAMPRSGSGHGSGGEEGRRGHDGLCGHRECQKPPEFHGLTPTRSVADPHVRPPDYSCLSWLQSQCGVVEGQFPPVTGGGRLNLPANRSAATSSPRSRAPPAGSGCRTCAARCSESGNCRRLPAHGPRCRATAAGCPRGCTPPSRRCAAGSRCRRRRRD